MMSRDCNVLEYDHIKIYKVKNDESTTPEVKRQSSVVAVDDPRFFLDLSKFSSPHCSVSVGWSMPILWKVVSGLIACQELS